MLLLLSPVRLRLATKYVHHKKDVKKEIAFFSNTAFAHLRAFYNQHFWNSAWQCMCKRFATLGKSPKFEWKEDSLLVVKVVRL